MITARPGVFALALVSLALVACGDEPSEGDTDAVELAADQAVAEEDRLSCTTTFVRRASHAAAQLHLLPTRLAFDFGGVNLRENTLPGATSCRLQLDSLTDAD
jgi:hypothetical protein